MCYNFSRDYNREVRMVASPLVHWEELVLYSMGKIVAGIGIVGLVVSITFDYIARGMPIGQWQFDWLQITGILVSLFMTLLGIFGDSFLNGPVRSIIQEWAEN